VSAWVDRLDTAGQPHTSNHRDGHKVGLFSDGWWAYHRDYKYTPPRRPTIGPRPVGPFNTLTDAKHFVEAQGWASTFPFSEQEQTA